MEERRTLDEVDPPAWGPPTYDSYLVTRCHELRKKPLADFTVEDLRVMIGQQISLPHLVPRAITALEANPLAEGDFYPGDLLHAVLRIDAQYWRANPEQWYSVSEVANTLASTNDDLRNSIVEFQSIDPEPLVG